MSEPIWIMKLTKKQRKFEKRKMKFLRELDMQAEAEAAESERMNEEYYDALEAIENAKWAAKREADLPIESQWKQRYNWEDYCGLLGYQRQHIQSSAAEIECNFLLIRDKLQSSRLSRCVSVKRFVICCPESASTVCGLCGCIISGCQNHFY